MVLALVFAAFSPSLGNQFINWDDPAYIVHNPDIQQLSWANIKAMFSGFVVGNYHPLTMLVFALQYGIAGAEPFIFHLTNLILHMMNVVLVYCFVLLLTRKETAALLACFLWGMHPLRVESIAWATELKDVLFAFFYLASLIFYLVALRDAERGKPLKFFSLLFFVLSLLSKQAAVSLPLVLVLIDMYQGRKIAWKLFAEKWLFFLLSLVFGLISFMAAYGPSDEYLYYPLVPDLNVIERVFLSFYALLFYIQKMFWPAGLAVYYPFPAKEGLSALFVLCSPLIVAAIGFLLARTRPPKETVFGIFFFVVTIIFNLPIFPVGYVLAADRFTYVPMIGVLIALTPLAVYWKDRRGRVALVAIGIVLTALTWRQGLVWRNNYTLWSKVIAHYPNVPLAYYNRVDYHIENNRLDLAVADYTRALEIYPLYYFAYNNRGNMHFLLGEYEKALADYEQAIAIMPTYRDAYLNKAAYHEFFKEYEKAMAAYERILSFLPQDAAAIERKNLLIEKMRAAQ